MTHHKTILRRPFTEKNKVTKDLHPILQRIYAARHITAEKELELGFDCLLPYENLLGIATAAKFIVAAIMQQKKILIVGDFDADGATSTAVAIRALRSFGAEHVDFLVPNRFIYGYGLTTELVAAAIAYKPEMIITVDNGIANHEGVAAAKAAGIEVIITDHHLPAATLPLADAIVNPNQHHDSFASKCLAGVGVIFYVMLAVRKELVNLNWFAKMYLPPPNMAKLLDIVALGTVADVVPLDQNNRILVQHGLKRIRAGECIPAIAVLLELAKRNIREVVCADLGFAVAARLNAAGRLQDMSLGIECLLTDDRARARELAERLDALNRERRVIEQDMQREALNLLTNIEMKLTDLPVGVSLYEANWHQGVIGILASRLKDKFNRPVIIFADGLQGEIKGSGRSIAGFHLRDALALLNTRSPDLILRFGGHAMAAGLTIAKERFAEFAEKFNQCVAAQLTAEQLAHVIYTDGELTLADFNLELALQLRDAMPWGQAFPEPIFDNVFEIVEQRIVGTQHLKLRLKWHNKLIDAIAFFVNTDIWPMHRLEFVRAVYRLDINEFNGQRKLQLIVDYLEEATASAYFSAQSMATTNQAVFAQGLY